MALAQIPEILAHAWLQNFTPGIVYVPAPPVSELARPLKSAAHIDRDLFESLRVIWGRHADPKSLAADLLSPAGEGTLAKVFYFLLHQHRRRTLEENGFVMDFNRSCTSPRDGNDKCKIITKQYTAPHSAVPHPNQRTVNTQTRAHVRSNRISPMTTSRCLPPIQIPSLAPPMSKIDSRSRMPSPCGPRPPRPRPLSTPISCPPPANGLHPPTGANFGSPAVQNNVQPSRMSRTPTPSHFSNFHSREPAEHQFAGSPPPSRTPSHVQQAPFIEPPRGPLPVKYTASSIPQSSFPVVIGQRRNTVSPTSQPVHIHAPRPIPPITPLEPIPMLTAPRTDNPVVQRTIDDIAERVNVLVARGNNTQFVHQPENSPNNTTIQACDKGQSQSRLPRAIGSQLPSAAAAPSHRLGDRRDRILSASAADKENRLDDAAHYVIVDSIEKGEGLGLNKAQFATDVTYKAALDIGENKQDRMVGVRPMRERKERGSRRKY